ncbi:MAG TPA: hypothetical protein VK133_00270 [Amoebophilaceae bacterium]|nr:hypothetical protein [Amoebophilaceae bacterium]
MVNCRWVLVIGIWLVGQRLLAFGTWSSVIGHRSSVIGHRSSGIGHWSLVFGLLVIGLLVSGQWFWLVGSLVG